MTSEVPSRTRRSTVTAFVLFGLAVAEVLAAVIGAPVVGLSLTESIDLFLVTNSAIGLSCAVAGVLVAWQRPHNAVGWLLLGAGCFQAVTAAAAPLISAGLKGGWSDPAVRTVATVAAYSWPWSIGLCLPLALLLFPDGRLPDPRWRPVRWLAFRLVFSRAVLYAVLTAAVIGTYIGLVAVADVVRQDIGLGSPVLATLIIAVGFNPVRVRLQRLVDRALYGDRADPARAVARMGERLVAAGTGADPTDVLNAVREALRLPYAALRARRAGLGRAGRSDTWGS